MSSPRSQTESVETLHAEWSALRSEVGASPFLAPEWIAAWGRAFDAEVVARTVRDASGNLQAILPMIASRGEVRSPTNWHTPEFSWISSSPEATRALLESLEELRPRRITLNFLSPPDAGLWQQLPLAKEYRTLSRVMQESPTLPLDGDRAAFEASLPRKVRSELRRRRRRLEGEGVVTFEVTEGAALAERLEDGFRVESAGWKGARGTAIASAANTREFYSEVAQWGADAGVLRLAFLRIDERPIAFDLCFEEGGRHYLIKTGFDVELASFGVGKILRQEMIGRACDLGLRSYEFLGQTAPWKREWTTEARLRIGVQSFRRSAAGLVDWAAYRHGRPLARRVRGLVRKASSSARGAARTPAGGKSGE